MSGPLAWTMTTILALCAAHSALYAVWDYWNRKE